MTSDIPPVSPVRAATAWDAIVVAGGRAKRLGGIDKTALVWRGRRLLDGVLLATAGARRVCVVGSDAVLPPSVLRTVEQPRWGGPAAAIVAALDVLTGARNGAGSHHAATHPSADASAPAGVARSSVPASGPDSNAAPDLQQDPVWVVILAGDLVRPAGAVEALLAGLNRLVQDLTGAVPELDGVISVDAGGRRQPLLAVYRRAALVASAQRIGSAQNLSVTGLIGGLNLRELHLPDGLSDDVDTPADAGRLGITLPDTTGDPAGGPHPDATADT